MPRHTRRPLWPEHGAHKGQRGQYFAGKDNAVVFLVAVTHCQNWWFKTTQMCYLTTLEARKLKLASLVKMEVWAGLCSFLEALKENLFSCVF